VSEDLKTTADNHLTHENTDQQHQPAHTHTCEIFSLYFA